MGRFPVVLRLIAGLLLVLECGPVSGQGEKYAVVISNKSGKDLQYRYRGGENTGKPRPYTTVTHQAGTTVRLPYVASADYGIVLRLPTDQPGRSLFQTFGPYEIRADGRFYDAKGREVVAKVLSD